MGNEINKAKKVTIDDLARMVQRGFLEQKAIIEEFRAENARDHAKNEQDHAEFRQAFAENKRDHEEFRRAFAENKRDHEEFRRAFAENKRDHEEFRRDHAENARDHGEFRFLLSEKVTRVEHLTLEDRLKQHEKQAVEKN